MRQMAKIHISCMQLPNLTTRYSGCQQKFKENFFYFFLKFYVILLDITIAENCHRYKLI